MSQRKRSDRRSLSKLSRKTKEERRARSRSSRSFNRPTRLKVKRRVQSTSNFFDDEKKLNPEHEFIPVCSWAHPSKLPKRANRVSSFKDFYSSKKWGKIAYINDTSSWDRVAISKSYKKRSKCWGVRMHGPVYEAKCNAISMLKVTKKAERKFKQQFLSEMKGSGRTTLPKPGEKAVWASPDYDKRRTNGQPIISAAVQNYQNREIRETLPPAPRVDGKAIIDCARSKAARQEIIDLEKAHDSTVLNFLKKQGIWPTPNPELSNLRYVLKEKTYKVARLTAEGRDKLIPPWVNCTTEQEFNERMTWYGEWAQKSDGYIVIIKRKLGHYLVRNIAGGPIFNVPCTGRTLEVVADPQRDHVLRDMARVNLLTIVQWSTHLPPYIVGYIVDYALRNDCVYLYVFPDLFNLDDFSERSGDYRLWV
jgi:hypothetical protein